jgi:hypothetical protein
MKDSVSQKIWIICEYKFIYNFFERQVYGEKAGSNNPIIGTQKEYYNTEVGDDHSADMYILTISNTHCIIC